MKLALVHDYINEAGGAERVLRVLADMYPEALIYTAFVKNGTAKKMFANRKIIESKWGWLLKMGKIYSYGRFCLPWVWKSIDLRDYDTIITSCSGYIARGFRVREGAKVIAYCHTPPRWLYGYETPTGAQAKWWGKVFMFVVGPLIRYFDYESSKRVDKWIANSQEVAGRIAKFYRKKAIVINPPIELGYKERDKVKKGEYYLLVSRIVGGKGIEEAIVGAKKAGVELKIVGEQVGKSNMGVNAQGIDYRGRVGEDELNQLYAGAKGFIALARDEDFGMTVVEAMSWGVPVLVYRGGGYRETVVEGVTGVFVNDTDIESVAEGIKKMEKIRWNRVKIVTWAKQFGREKFEEKIREVVKQYATKSN